MSCNSPILKLPYEALAIITFLQKDETPSSVSELNLENVGGIFLVLLIGLILGGGMAAAEFFWQRCKKPQRQIQ